MRTMGQKRAEFALTKILNLKLQNKEKVNFGTLAKGAPSMILQNGFGQALAFWIVKGTKDNKIKENDKYIILFDMIKEWLSYKNGDIDNNFADNKNDRKDFIKNISQMDQKKYITVQQETLKLLEWVKRYASADL